MVGFPRMEGQTRIHNAFRGRMDLLLHHISILKITIAWEEVKIMLEKKLRTSKTRSETRSYRIQTS